MKPRQSPACGATGRLFADKITGAIPTKTSQAETRILHSYEIGTLCQDARHRHAFVPQIAMRRPVPGKCHLRATFDQPKMGGKALDPFEPEPVSACGLAQQNPTV
jgi:hypothetical protein